jgi:hypothetical protein
VRTECKNQLLFTFVKIEMSKNRLTFKKKTHTQTHSQQVKKRIEPVLTQKKKLIIFFPWYSASIAITKMKRKEARGVSTSSNVRPLPPPPPLERASVSFRFVFQDAPSFPHDRFGLLITCPPTYAETRFCRMCFSCLVVGEHQERTQCDGISRC